MLSRGNCLYVIRNCLFKRLQSQSNQEKIAQKFENAERQKNHHPLVDTFGRKHNYLRISLSEKCNLRCKYCMPAEGVQLTERDKLLTTKEIIKICKIFTSIGVDKVRLTGGEPTVRRDIVDVVAQIKALPNMKTVGMTTNGLTLTRLLPKLQRAGLDALNISLDTLQHDKFQQITRTKGFDRVVAGIDLALQLGYKPVKINCVAMKDFNLQEVPDFVEFTKDKEVDIRFIEFMPFTGNKWDETNLVSYIQLLDIIKERWPNFMQLKNDKNDTAKSWKVPGYKGIVSFITSMTNNFCSTCNRLRITADGNLKVCLFGKAEVSLRDAMRQGASNDELVELVSQAIARKHKRHAGMLNLAKMENRPMILIGG